MTALPGPALDDRVAAAIGWTGELLPWSTNAGAALALLENQHVKLWELSSTANGVRCSVLLGRGMGRVEGQDIAHAIALAVVAAHQNRVERGCCGDG